MRAVGNEVTLSSVVVEWCRASSVTKAASFRFVPASRNECARTMAPAEGQRDARNRGKLERVYQVSIHRSSRAAVASVPLTRRMGVCPRTVQYTSSLGDAMMGEDGNWPKPFVLLINNPPSSCDELEGLKAGYRHSGHDGRAAGGNSGPGMLQ